MSNQNRADQASSSLMVESTSPDDSLNSGFATSSTGSGPRPTLPYGEKSPMPNPPPVRPFGTRPWSSLSEASSTPRGGYHHRSSAVVDYSSLLKGASRPIGWGPIHPRPKQSKMVLIVKCALLYAPLSCVALFLFQLLHPHALPTINALFKTLHSTMDQAVFLTRPYQCPSPLIPRLPLSDNTDPLEFTPYEHIQSKSSSFQIELAHSVLACNHLKVRITRVDREICAKAAEELVQSKALKEEDETTLHQVLTELGPDTFQLRFDGAERLVVGRSRFYNERQCEWEYEVRLNNAGTAWLEILHEHENFNAYKTPSNTTAPVPRLSTSLFPSPLELNTCSTKCASYQPPIVADRPFVFPAPETPQSHLPVCSKSGPVAGSYIPTPIPSLLYPSNPLLMTEHQPLAGLHTFVPSGCRFDHAGLRYRDRASCLQRKKRVLFVGDSHAKVLYEATRQRLLGNDGFPAEVDDSKDEEETLVGNVLLEYKWDSFLFNSTSCSSSGGDPYDAIVMSAGTLHAADLCSSTPVFLSSLNSTLSQCLTASRKAQTKHIYVTPPAFHSSKEENEDERDCRTSPRLQEWSKRAVRMALKKKWSVVDAYALTNPASVDTALTDGMHYLQNDAVIPLVDEVLQKMETCNYGETENRSYNGGRALVGFAAAQRKSAHARALSSD